MNASSVYLILYRTRCLVLLCFALVGSACFAAEAQRLVVASKRFTESYLLAEIISQTLETKAAAKVERKPGLGNTAILFSALQQGSIDIYPEYVGTITKEILKVDEKLTIEQINQRLAFLGLKAEFLLGFNNSYAFAMRAEKAQQLNITSIGDLINHPQLRFGLSHEFLGRKDGWPAIRQAYELTHSNTLGLDHGLSYKALEKGQVDVIDAYTTDAALSNSSLVLLEDSKGFFPTYEAILLYRIDAFRANRSALESLQTLEGSISQTQMQRMNAAVEQQGESISSVAQRATEKRDIQADQNTFYRRLFDEHFIRLTLEHSFLVAASLIVAMLVGIPLGMSTFLRPQLGNPVLYLSGVFQTIPSLALLAFLIGLFKSIGAVPAIVALTIYALLPIIENTYSGLKAVDPFLKESARALGANRWICLIRIEMPAAALSILSGIKVAALSTTGTATIAAFVGAGGYGERIAEGLATNNTETMLAGALPAAMFALLLQALLNLVGRALGDKGSKPLAVESPAKQ
jgi:osmoprotectant transport system permease protein